MPVPELTWFELFPPPEVELADVTGAVRVLAGRSRRGWQRLTPVISFEVWLFPGRVRWLLGTDVRLSRSLPRELRAQLPTLTVVRCEDVPRWCPTTAREVRFVGLAFPLRLDTAAALTAGVVAVSEELRGTECAVLQWVVGPSIDRVRRPSEFAPLEALGLRAPAKPDAGERTAWRAKTSEPLFAVRGRLGATAHGRERAGALINSVRAAVALASGPHARLRVSQQSNRTAQQLFAVQGRARTWSSILNAGELATVVAWPQDGVSVPGQPVAFAPPPTPLLVPGTNNSDDADEDGRQERLLGRSLHPASAERLVALPTQSCLSHVHLIGPTGSGKSNELAQWIVADAAAGHGVLVIEPKADLVADVLSRLPAKQHADAVVIEPGDGKQVVGLNPLAGAPEDAERRADELLAMFRELFGSAIGARSADLLLHALITAARLPDGTLTDVPALLSSPGFRRQALSTVSDPLLLAPFWASFEARSEPDKAQAIAPIMNKLRVFISRPAIRRLLGQAQPRFNLDELFTHRRTVLVSLNQGVLGPETAQLLGALLLSQLWRAIQRRAATPATERHPVMVVVDEWQSYAAALDFADVLATSRGLGVSWTLAHQHLAQLNPTLRAAVLANARSRVAFRPAHDDAKSLADVLGDGIAPADLERLGAFQAAARVLVDAAPSRAFAVQTLPIPAASHDAAELRRRSRERYGVDADELDASLLRRWQGSDQPPGESIGVTRRRRP
ncbi:MAG: type IV secretory system conjugative DNA transfer family protein [Pseudonocardiaceae bacterium]